MLCTILSESITTSIANSFSPSLSATAWQKQPVGCEMQCCQKSPSRTSNSWWIVVMLLLPKSIVLDKFVLPMNILSGIKFFKLSTAVLQQPVRLSQHRNLSLENYKTTQLTTFLVSLSIHALSLLCRQGILSVILMGGEDNTFSLVKVESPCFHQPRIQVQTCLFYGTTQQLWYTENIMR